MLKKLRLTPRVLAELVFIFAVWLCSWLVFHARLGVWVVVIFAAYALASLFELAISMVEKRRERFEQRRLRRERSTRHDWSGSNGRTLPPPGSAVGEVRRVEPALETQPLLEQLIVEMQARKSPQEDELPPEVIAAEVERAREQAERERAEQERIEHERAAAQLAERIRAEQEQAERERTASERAARERAEREAAEREAAARTPIEAEPEPEPEPREPRSLLAEFAASPGEARHTHPVGGWNVWQLERMMAAGKPDPERDYERSLLLVYLREFADSDGQLSPEFDELVNETFGDLVRGPSGS